MFLTCNIHTNPLILLYLTHTTQLAHQLRPCYAGWVCWRTLMAQPNALIFAFGPMAVCIMRTLLNVQILEEKPKQVDTDLLCGLARSCSVPGSTLAPLFVLLSSKAQNNYALWGCEMSPIVTTGLCTVVLCLWKMKPECRQGFVAVCTTFRSKLSYSIVEEQKTNLMSLAIIFHQIFD